MSESIDAHPEHSCLSRGKRLFLIKNYRDNGQRSTAILADARRRYADVLQGVASPGGDPRLSGNVWPPHGGDSGSVCPKGSGFNVKRLLQLMYTDK